MLGSDPAVSLEIATIAGVGAITAVTWAIAWLS